MQTKYAWTKFIKQTQAIIKLETVIRVFNVFYSHNSRIN